MTPTPFTALGSEQFVRLTTYKRDGTAVPTTVWLVADGDDLLVTTLGTTGKAKRIRHTSRVVLVPSSRTGTVEDGAVEVEGSASLFSDEPGLKRLADLLVDKYGLLARGMFAVSKVSRKDGDRVGIRVAPAT